MTVVTLPEFVHVYSMMVVHRQRKDCSYCLDRKLYIRLLGSVDYSCSVRRGVTVSIVSLTLLTEEAKRTTPGLLILLCKDPYVLVVLLTRTLCPIIFSSACSADLGPGFILNLLSEHSSVKLGQGGTESKNA